MPAVLVTGPTAMQDPPFFLYGYHSHSQYSLLPTQRGMAQAELTWLPGSVLRWFTGAYPGTNRARRRVTMLIVTKPAPYDGKYCWLECVVRSCRRTLQARS